VSSIVSSITGQKGGNAGGAGLNYNAASANILQPTTVDQANQAYAQSQQAIENQGNFLSATLNQNGLANQASAFNQLQNVANGQGPNPAQAQLAQATGANIASQNALMAGQRGAGANVGLIARQAAQQGAATQQNAIGQAATLQANQSLNALGQLSGIAGTQVAQQQNASNAYTGATQGEQSQILGGIAAQNNANVGMVSNQNTANAGISQIAAGQQGNLIGNITGGIGSALQGLAKGGKVQNYVTGGSVYQDIAPGSSPFDTQGQSSVLSVPVGSLGVNTNLQTSAPTATIQTPGVQAPTTPGQPKSNVGKFFSGLGQGKNLASNSKDQPDGASVAGQAIGKGIGSGLNALFHGVGQIFGSSNPSAAAQLTSPVPADGSMYSQGIQSSAANNATSQAGGPADNVQQDEDGAMNAARGGKVPALVSPGEVFLPPNKAKDVAKGKADPIKDGKKVPGKPKYPGNDYRNDTVPAKLEEGGVVIPNSIMQSKEPAKEAAAFVRGIMARQSLKKGK
jgi:hypothetical protein